MAGLLFGSALKGLGEGGNKYIDIEEQRRRDEASRNQRFAEIDYASQKQQEGKDTEQERQLAFKQEAADWRGKNPEASMSDFVTHFATTEYADLLGPTLQAANLISAEQRRALDERLEMMREKRAGRAEARAGAHDAILLRRLKMDEAKQQRELDKEQIKEGLIQGYLSSRTNSPTDAEEYRQQLITGFGFDPAGKGQGQESTVTTTRYDEQGNEIKETSKGKAPGPKSQAVAGAQATTETYKGHTVWMKDGQYFFYDPSRGGAAVRLEK